MTSGKRSKRLRAQSRVHTGSDAVDKLETRRRRTRLLVALAVAASAAGLGVGSEVAFGGSDSVAGGSGPAPIIDTGSVSVLGPLLQPPGQNDIGPEGIPIPDAPLLTNPDTDAVGAPVDQISCDTTEQVVYHIHVHLTVFVDGSQRQIPFGIGIPDPQEESTPQGPFVVSGSCFYWLHTHSGDGIIHVESPTQRTYTLGQFFDIWGQPLSATQVGPAIGTVVAFYNRRHYLSDPRDIPLTPHANVQLDVGSPLVGPITVSSWGHL